MKKNEGLNKKIVYSGLETIIALFFCNLVICITDAMMTTVHILAFIIYLRFLYIVIRHDMRFFALVNFLTILSFGALISLFICEMNSSFSFELSENILMTGAFIRLTFYNVVLLFSAWIVGTLNLSIVSQDNIGKMDNCMAIGFVLAACCLMIVCYGIYGSPFFLGLERYQYWNVIVTNPILNLVKNNLHICVVLVCILYRRNRNIAKILFIILGIIGVLSGSKFSMFMVWLLNIFMITTVQYELKLNRKYFKRIFLVVLTFFTFISCMVYLNYGAIVEKTSYSIDELITMRFTEQGQMWWAVDKVMSSAGDVDESHILESINEIIMAWKGNLTKADMSNVGIYKMMYLVGPPSVVDRFLEGGVVWTSAYPAIGLYYFGYIGLLFLQIIAGIIVGIWSRFMYYAIRRNDVLDVILLLIVNTHIISAFLMGELYHLLQPIVFVVLLVLLVKHAFKKGGWVKLSI